MKRKMQTCDDYQFPPISKYITCFYFQVSKETKMNPEKQCMFAIYVTCDIEYEIIL